MYFVCLSHVTFLHSPDGVPNTILNTFRSLCCIRIQAIALLYQSLFICDCIYLEWKMICIFACLPFVRFSMISFRLSTSVSNMKYYIRFTAYRTTQWSTSEVIVPCRIRFPALKQFPNELLYWHCTVKRRQTWQSETINLILIFCVLPYENNSRQLSLRFPDSRLLKKPAPKSSWKSL